MDFEQKTSDQIPGSDNQKPVSAGTKNPGRKKILSSNTAGNLRGNPQSLSSSPSPSPFTQNSSGQYPQNSPSLSPSLSPGLSTGLSTGLLIKLLKPKKGRITLLNWLRAAEIMRPWRDSNEYTQAFAAGILGTGKSGIREIKRLEKAGAWPERIKRALRENFHLLALRDVRQLAEKSLDPNQLDTALRRMLAGKKPFPKKEKKAANQDPFQAAAQMKTQDTETMILEERLRGVLGTNKIRLTKNDSGDFQLVAELKKINLDLLLS